MKLPCGSQRNSLCLATVETTPDCETQSPAALEWGRAPGSCSGKASPTTAPLLEDFSCTRTFYIRSFTEPGVINRLGRLANLLTVLTTSQGWNSGIHCLASSPAPPDSCFSSCFGKLLVPTIRPRPPSHCLNIYSRGIRSLHPGYGISGGFPASRF